MGENGLLSRIWKAGIRRIYVCQRERLADQALREAIAALDRFIESGKRDREPFRVWLDRWDPEFGSKEE